jgi:tight adherence protein B
MNLILVGAIFLVSAALILCALYFGIAVPAADKVLRKRMRAIQESALPQSLDLPGDLLSHEVFSELPAFQRLLLRMPVATKLRQFLQQSGMDITPGNLVSISIAVTVGVLLVCLLLPIPGLASLLTAMVCGSVPVIVIAVKRQKRFSKFDEQFPEAINLLARTVRAGHAFTTGLELISTEMPSPVSEEFRRAYEQQNLGLPLREALQNLLLRVPLPDVHVFVTALIIQRETGGNLAEILDNLSSVIRDRFKLMRQVRVLTAQGRTSLYVLTAMPPLIALTLYAVSPGYISRLFTDPLGHKMLAAAVVLQVMGYLVISRIVKPKS